MARSCAPSPVRAYASVHVADGEVRPNPGPASPQISSWPQSPPATADPTTRILSAVPPAQIRRDQEDPKRPASSVGTGIRATQGAEQRHPENGAHKPARMRRDRPPSAGLGNGDPGTPMHPTESKAPVNGQGRGGWPPSPSSSPSSSDSSPAQRQASPATPPGQPDTSSNPNPNEPNNKTSCKPHTRAKPEQP